MTTKYVPTALAVTLGLLTTAAPAATQIGDTGLSISGNVALTSDYTFRGFSQTGEGPALQGGFDLTHESGFYVGNWNSSVEFADASLEHDYYAGWAGSFNNFSVDVGAIYFLYPDTGADSDGEDFDYGELYGTLGYDFGFASVSAGFDVTNEFFDEAGDAQHYRASVTVPINEVISVGANVGHQDVDEVDDWTHYGLNVSASFADHYTATLSGVGTDADDSDAGDDRVEFMLSASF